MVCEKCHDSGYLNGVQSNLTGDVYKINLHSTVNTATGEITEYKEILTPGEIGRLFRYPMWSHFVQPCSCAMQQGVDQLLQALKSTIPDDVKHFSSLAEFEHLDGAQDAISAAHAVLEGYEINIDGTERPGAVFYGGTGTGKSSLAYVIYSHFVRLGVSCAWLDYRDLVNSIRETYGDMYRGQPLAGLCKPYAAATVLIIDELGSKTRETVMFEDLLEAMRLIFHPRYNGRKVTIATTNLKPALLKHQFDDLAYSRMAGNCHFIEMSGVDMRAGV